MNNADSPNMQTHERVFGKKKKVLNVDEEVKQKERIRELYTSRCFSTRSIWVAHFYFLEEFSIRFSNAKSAADSGLVTRFSLFYS
jgi:hypothetical protein